MSQVNGEVLVEIRLASVISDIGTIVDRTRKVALAVKRVTGIHGGLVGEVIVNALHRAVGVLRDSRRRSLSG